MNCLTQMSRKEELKMDENSTILSTPKLIFEN